MPFNYGIDTEHEFGSVVWQGVVEGKQILEAMEALFFHPDWKPGYRHCWDGRRITSLVLDLEDARTVSRYLRAVRMQMGPGKAATILWRDFHFIGGQLLITMSRVALPHVRVCRTADEAVAWLGVSPALLDPSCGPVGSRAA